MWGLCLMASTCYQHPVQRGGFSTAHVPRVKTQEPLGDSILRRPLFDVVVFNCFLFFFLDFSTEDQLSHRTEESPLSMTTGD